MKPFLKWAGSKYRVLPQILSALPKGNRLIEPFCGSAALFLNTDFEYYLLADKNTDLIELYQILKAEPDSFIEYCDSFFRPENNKAERYYELREVFNHTTELWLKSALLVYLNRHCYNGLVRYNKTGFFNTPFGSYKEPYFPREEMLFFAKKATRAEFLCEDFRTTLGRAEAGDVVYCDPPYLALSKSANFTAYQPESFSIKDQLSLANMALSLSKGGVPVLVSNHDSDFIQKNYACQKFWHFEVARMISCLGNKRSKAREILALFQAA